MPPHEPPLLQPQTPVAEHKSAGAKKRHAKQRSIVWVTYILVAALVIAVAWFLFVKPRSDLAAVVQHFANQKYIQTKGSLQTLEKNQGQLGTIDFSGQLQPELFYINGTLSLMPSGQKIAIPAEIIVDKKQNSYLKLKENRFSDTLIKNSNPDTALKLLNADSVFNTLLKDKWLQLSSKDRKNIYDQQAGLAPLNVIPAQQCVAVLLDGDNANNAMLIKSFSEIMASQTVNERGVEVVAGRAQTRYAISISPDELKAEWDTLLASSNVKAFNKCAQRQPGLGVPKVSIDMWVDKSSRQFSRVLLTFDMLTQQTTLDMSLAYNPEVSPKGLPKNAINLALLNQQIKSNQTAINDTFTKRLADFRELNSLVTELRKLEDLRQGL